MAKQLGETNDPREVVPGNSDTVSTTLWLMRGYGDALADAGAGLRRIDTTDGWRGPAGDAFRAVFDGQPARWTEAGDCFHHAADALESYVSTLDWAQGQAREAVHLWNDGQAVTAQAKAAHEVAVRQAQQEAAAQTAAGTPTVAPDIPFIDPGEAKRQAARDQFDRARAHASHVGDAAEHTVAIARDKAPKKPGFWSKVGHFFTGVAHEAENIGADLVDGAASIGGGGP